MLNLFTAFRESFFALVYPPLCLYCNASLDASSKLLCASCLELVTLIPLENRCQWCFDSMDNCEKRTCRACLNNPMRFSLNGAAAAFDHMGPIAAIIKKMKYGGFPQLADALAPFLIMQLAKMPWPSADIIVPVPQSFTHWISRGYNQSQLLSNSLGNILECPVVEPIQRFSGEWRQAGLDYKQRLQWDGSSLQLVAPHLVEDKHILLVDDVSTTGCTLRNCAKKLREATPRSIYAITVCKAVH